MQYDNIMSMRTFWTSVLRMCSEYQWKKYRLVCKGFRDIIDTLMNKIGLTSPQETALQAIMASKFKAIKLMAPMSFGKTIVAVLYAHQYPGPVVIETTAAIMKQWHDEIRKWIGSDRDFLFGYSDYDKKGCEYLSACLKNNEKPVQKCILLTSAQRKTQSVLSLLGSNTLIIIDECHKGDGYRFTYLSGDRRVAKILGLTASFNWKGHSDDIDVISIPNSEIKELIPTWECTPYIIPGEYIHFGDQGCPGIDKEWIDMALALFQLKGKTLVFICRDNFEINLPNSMLYKKSKDPIKFLKNTYDFLIIPLRKTTEGLNMPQVRNVIVFFPEHASNERIQQVIGRTTRVTSSNLSVNVISVCDGEDYNVVRAHLNMMNKDVSERFTMEFTKKYKMTYSEEKKIYADTHALTEYQYYVLFSYLTSKHSDRVKYYVLFGNGFNIYDKRDK